MSTTLNCYPWMRNQEGQDPCTIAQEVGQLCNLAYTLSLTNFQEGNYVPNATTANGCTCSWSIYNLLSACSYCVGQYQYTSWSTWITNCASYVSNNSYLPFGLSLSQGIPFWATTNPFTWENGVFNITHATNIASQDNSDVTSALLPTSTATSTATASSSPSVSIGGIVGGVIGGILIVVIGGLLIFWVVRRHRRQRTHTGPIGVPSFSASHLGVVPSAWSRTPAQATPSEYAPASSAPVSPYLISPIHSTTSLAPTSLASPVSAGFSSSGHNAAPPISDAADMVTPFLATYSRRQTNRSSTSPPTGKAAEALSELVMAPTGQRIRLNPPSYSASMVPEPSGAATNWSRRPSTKKHKKREGSVSGTTTHSGYSRMSTRENVTTANPGSRTEQSRPRATTPGSGTVQSVESAVGAGGLGSVDGGGSMKTTRAGASGQRPPAV